MQPSKASEPRLIADAMLGKLARWLRILGYDTLYNPRWPDNELVRLARAEGRILLTRDVELARRRGVRMLFVVHDRVEAQLRQVVASLGLPADGQFSRCPVCNEPLEAVPKSWAWGYVPPYTFCTQREFRLCPRCNHFYWRGTHWQRMQRVIEDLRDATERSRGRVENRA
jgi:uncharacterized protein with PIN domain